MRSQSEKPVIAAQSPAEIADFQKKLVAIEEENRGVYYNLVDRIQSEIFNKIDSYLLV